MDSASWSFRRSRRILLRFMLAGLLCDSTTKVVETVFIIIFVFAVLAQPWLADSAVRFRFGCGDAAGLIR